MEIHEFNQHLEEIATKTLTLREKIQKELQPKFEAEMQRYETENRMPSKLRLIARKKWQQGKEVIREKYKNHQLMQELYRLQDSCPHRFTHWWQAECYELFTHHCLVCDQIEEKASGLWKEHFRRLRVDYFDKEGYRVEKNLPTLSMKLACIQNR